MPEERNEWKMELLSKNELDLQIWKILSLSISQKVRKRVQERTLCGQVTTGLVSVGTTDLISLIDRSQVLFFKARGK